MRRIISMPAAIIAALIMLAVFDSAARCDEQAQFLKLRETVWAVLTKNLVAQEIAQRPSHRNIAKGTDTFRHSSNLAERFQSFC